MMTAAAPPQAPQAPQPPQARGLPELCTLAEIGEEARAFLGAGGASPRTFVVTLIEHGLYADAVRVLAHALPRREAVWWAWVCARKASGAEPTPQVKAALDATERWIVQPTDEYRREAHRLGEEADFGTAAGCAALAAFM